MEFRTKLKKLLADRRLSQEDVARAIDVSQNQVSRWTRGTTIPDMQEAAALARFLGVPLPYLADDAIEDPAAAASEPVTEEEMYILRFVRRKGLDWASAIVGLAEEVRRRDEQGGETARILLQSPLSPAELDRIRREIEKGDGPGGEKGNGGGGIPGRTGPQKEEKLEAPTRRRRADHGGDAHE